MACPKPKRIVTVAAQVAHSRPRAIRQPLSESEQKRQLPKKRLSPETVKRFQVVALTEICRVLNCSRPTVYRLVRQGELQLLTVDGFSESKPQRINGLVCVTLASWNAYRERNGIA